MQQIKLRAMAKINLGLDVAGTRPDGYHDLRMVMQSVRLCDRLAVTRTEAQGIRMKTNLGFLPTDDSNLAAKAARLMIEAGGITQGVFIELEKHIPVAAGLAGGSSDAAAVLVGMNLLFHLGYSQKKLREIGVTIGADVPFCVMRGTALAEGIGEVLTPLPPVPECSILIARPDLHVSTKYVFTHLKMDEKIIHPDIDSQVQAVREGDLQKICSLCGNVLETVTETEYPVIGRIKKTMRENGALAAMMSGSGPAVFGIFDSERAARSACGVLRGGGDARRVYLTKPFG